MCITSQYDRHSLLATEAQDSQVVVVCLHQATRRAEACVVDLKQRVRLGRCHHQGLEVQFGCPVTWVADDVRPGIPYGRKHSLGVLLARASLPAEAVYACYTQVHHAVILLVEVQRALCVQYVQLGAQQQPHAIHLARNHVQVAEVYGITGAGDVWPVLRDAQYLQSLCGSFVHHLLYGAEGMPAHYRVGVHIQLDLTLLFLDVHIIPCFIYPCSCVDKSALRCAVWGVALRIPPS